MAWPRADVLEAIQQAGVFNDCKQFVDMPLRVPLKKALLAFDDIINSSTPGGAGDLRPFLENFFDAAGSDLLEDELRDWLEHPKDFLKCVQNPVLRAFAVQVHSLWKILCRKVASNIELEPDQHTLLPLPHPVIVPGDRFREVYYWDSFWIIKGLLASGMPDTATNVLCNLMALLDKFGFVPNGARIYYCNRSQPPLLSNMVQLLWNATQNKLLVEQALPLLVREHQYWTAGNKMVCIKDADGVTHTMARYFAEWFAPRPESYREDSELAEGLSPEAAQEMYCNIASAAESGWDFSSRWFADSSNISTIQTTKVVPVDLNAFLYQMERNISAFAAEMGDEQLQQHFQDAAQQRLFAIQSVLWHPEGGCWYDVTLKNQDEHGIWTGQHNFQAFASNWVPLWCGCCEPGSNQAEICVASLQESGLVMPAGVSTTLNSTGQQWDFPNAWPPLQHMLVEGLGATETKAGQALAAQLASRYVLTCFEAFKHTGQMHEKYNACEIGSIGGGGEYEPQTGFGWSNGVLLDFLEQHGAFMG